VHTSHWTLRIALPVVLASLTEPTLPMKALRARPSKHSRGIPTAHVGRLRRYRLGRGAAASRLTLHKLTVDPRALSVGPAIQGAPDVSVGNSPR